MRLEWPLADADESGEQFYSASEPSDSEGETVKPNVNYKSAGD